MNKIKARIITLPFWVIGLSEEIYLRIRRKFFVKLEDEYRFFGLTTPFSWYFSEGYLRKLTNHYCPKYKFWTTKYYWGDK